LISYQLSRTGPLATIILADKGLGLEPEQTPTHFGVGPTARIVSVELLNI
jgi:hypothetical protein